MIILTLPAGGRLAVRADDIELAQASPWGARIRLASTRSMFEVEHSLEELAERAPQLWMIAPNLRFDPDRIAAVWEKDETLHYQLESGFVFSQPDLHLDKLMSTLAEARRKRAATVEGEGDPSAPSSPA